MPRRPGVVGGGGAGRGGDPPTGPGGTGRTRFRCRHDQARHAGFRRCQGKAPCGGEARAGHLAHDGGDGAGAHAFLHRPKHIPVAAAIDDDQVAGGEPETAKAGSVKPPRLGSRQPVLAPQHRSFVQPADAAARRAQTRQKGEAKAGRRGAVTGAGGRGLVQGGDLKAGGRQGSVDVRDAETPCGDGHVAVIADADRGRSVRSRVTLHLGDAAAQVGQQVDFGRRRPCRQDNRRGSQRGRIGVCRRCAHRFYRCEERLPRLICSLFVLVGGRPGVKCDGAVSDHPRRDNGHRSRP